MMKSIFKQLRANSPLIHCITNPISINQCANLILALGARPIMAEHPHEVFEITNVADALLLNLGNITDARMESMPISAQCAKKNNIPTVLDAVGSACSELRKSFAINLLKSSAPTVLKGNYSEIKALHHAAYFSKGVDAEKELDVSEICAISANLAKKYNCIVLASGKTDIITDGKRAIYVSNGCSQLGLITGTGCMLGAITACFLTIGRTLEHIACACSYFGICGELAADAAGPASFAMKIIDNAATLTDVEKYIRMEEIKIESI